MGGGLARRLPGWHCDGPAGARVGLDPGDSGLQLQLLRQLLPVVASRQRLPRPPHLQPGVPPSEDGVTLGSVTLVPCAAQRTGWPAVRHGAEQEAKRERMEIDLEERGESVTANKETQTDTVKEVVSPTLLA